MPFTIKIFLAMAFTIVSDLIRYINFGWTSMTSLPTYGSTVPKHNVVPYVCNTITLSDITFGYRDLAEPIFSSSKLCLYYNEA